MSHAQESQLSCTYLPDDFSCDAWRGTCLTRRRDSVGAFAFTSFRSRDLMSRDSASANRVAEEVYPTPWCWISFLLMNHLPTITRTAFHEYVTVLCVLGGPTDSDIVGSEQASEYSFSSTWVIGSCLILVSLISLE
jgi:hypothetical protein